MCLAGRAALAPALVAAWDRIADRQDLGAPAKDAPALRVKRAPRTGAGQGTDESYSLALRSDGVVIEAGTDAGVFYALQTLDQWLTECAGGAVPTGHVRDAPDFERRGVMLDVSRSRVPRMDLLFELVELFSSLKFNELQLYTEHTFAYSQHAEVWRESDPFTPEEIRALDRFCAERFIELVPNQQSFGHMHHWLKRPRYRPLAECPEGVVHPFAFEPEPFSLCPGDPRVLTLLEELYDELFPCFASTRFNAGCDETFDLGQGRSRARCEEFGTGRVYLDFLLELRERVVARGHRMQFWADILLHHPELVPELPDDVEPLIWGYEADHPFELEAQRVGRSGLAFGVCPGTSTWQSFGGRTANAEANLIAAARAGQAHGASAYLVTDWGDRGHLQPLVASYAPWCRAAGLAWNATDSWTRAQWAARIERFVVRDEGHAAGELLLSLGEIGEATGLRTPNASPLSLLLTRYDQALDTGPLAALRPAGLTSALERVESVRGQLGAVRIRGSRGDLFTAEVEHALGLCASAARLGRARLAAGPRTPLGELPGAQRHLLAAELRAALERHEALWPRRSRPGELARSRPFLTRPLAALEA